MKEHSQVLFLLNDERETAYVMHKIPINQIIYPQFITAQQLLKYFAKNRKTVSRINYHRNLEKIQTVNAIPCVFRHFHCNDYIPL